jgi:hypothetical protein
LHIFQAVDYKQQENHRRRFSSMTESISGGSLELKNRNGRALVAKVASAMTTMVTGKPVKCMPEIKELGRTG